MTTTTTTTTNGKRKPKARSAKLTTLPLLTLTVDGEQFRYLLTPLTTDYGKAYTLTKLDSDPKDGPTSYAVCIDDGPGNADTCECRGFLRWGHCKHTAGLRALIEAGKL